MFKDVLNHANMVHWAEMGLVVFFLVFVGVAIWALTRPRRDVRRWAELPLEGELSAPQAITRAEVAHE